MFSYQKSGRYFAQTAQGLEDLAEKELQQLGARDIKTAFRGFYFSADTATLYRLNYCSRLLSRILAPLIRFDCHSDKYLYKTASKINWPNLIDLENTFAVKANVSHSNITHSQYAALRLKDAIVDVFRKKTGKRPNVDSRDPDVLFNLYIQNNKATIYLDTSGSSLHRRGYRQKSIEAPMQEIVAAAIVNLSGWNGNRPLIDPMCGSGTLLCEAMMHYCRIPASFLRKKFGFTSLPDFDAEIWSAVKNKADSEMQDLPTGLISGSDKSAAAVAAAKTNTECFVQGAHIALAVKTLKDIKSVENSVIICNPTYGKRLETDENINEFMKQLGNFLKQRCKGSDAYIYLGNRQLLKSIGLKPAWKKVLISGGLDGRLVKYNIY
ncbi:MAG: class I SAM-dependent RNA methyltransferase [Deltaproteobacteria bacterium]|jgi:putative N6-adenine-specific DNA methylase|nr:class I SAM-dependent RNA methyltransferase [Deltaproteobacteria bacterium]